MRDLMLTLDDAVKVARQLVVDQMDDDVIIRQELMQKCHIPPKDDPAKRLSDLIFDINPTEIASHIESDNLRNWCHIVQTEMGMAMIQMKGWAEHGSD